AVKAAYDLAAGKAPVSHTHPWSQITGVPAASLTAKGTVQLSSAINSTSEILAATPKAVKAAYDLANGKQPADATLTALAGLATAADRLPYFTGADRAALATLTAIGRAIIAKGSIKDVLNYLGLGEAAKRNVGTGANQIPDMSAYSSGSGWQKLPDGSIEQWGRINFPTNAAAVSTNVTFPIPFTQEPDVVIVYDGGFGGGNMWGATNWTRTGFVAHCNYGFEGGAFFAKGR
ncbi:phage tail protein, partial [Escherichia coli]|nr:phage tail protein [Escherichia coli]